MVAMVVTLIVTGAIYGLVAGGQSAFRREPALTDRQQNSRIAMALIEQDIQAAGQNVSAWTQVFTPNLDGVGPNAEDDLELIVGRSQCKPTRACLRLGDAAPNMILEFPIGLPTCFGTPVGSGGQLAAVVLGAPPTQLTVVGPLFNVGGASVCNAPAAGPSAVGTQATVRFDSGPAGWRTFGAAGSPAGNAPGTVTDIVAVEVVRYRVATDPNDPEAPNDPNFRHLWRSTTGGRDTSDNFAAAAAGIGNGTWQLVARGINDLQVQYLDGDGVAAGAPADTPQVIGANTEWNRIVRQVTVTVSSRVAGVSIAGFTGTDLSDPAQIRLGQLTSQYSPRAALIALQRATGNLQWK
jgi:hypothetical protein